MLRLNGRSSSREWAIHRAAEQGNLSKLITLFMQWREQQQASEFAADNPSSHGESSSDNERCNVLLRGPNELDTKYGKTVLMIAIVKCYLPVVDFLLNSGVDPDIQDREGRTALMISMKLHEKETNHFDFMRALIEKSNCNIRDTQGRVALLYAAKTGCKRAVEALVPLTDKTMYTDNQGVNPVMVAAARGQLEVLMELYRAHVDINAQDMNGMTALMFAAIGGRTDIVRRLLDFQCSVTTYDERGRCALMLASACGHAEIVSILLKDGQTDPSREDNNGWNSLMLAASNGWMGCVKLLCIGASKQTRVKAAELASLSYHDHVFAYLNSYHDIKTKEELDSVSSRYSNSSRSTPPTQSSGLNVTNEWVVTRTRNKLGNYGLAMMMSASSIDLASFGTSRWSGFRFKREKMLEPESAFDSADPKLRQELLMMIGLYLHKEGFSLSAMTLQDEVNMKIIEKEDLRIMARKVYDSIIAGEWDSVRKLLRKEMILGENYRKFLYSLYKQEYLELITKEETQKAFVFLHKRLKPLESLCNMLGAEKEFKDLCYLLTCKTVNDAESFRNWDSSTSREQLAETFQTMFSVELDHILSASSSSELGGNIDAERLIRLVQQAVAYQIEFSEYYNSRQSGATPAIRTLLEDYKNVKMPNKMYSSYIGHTHNVKCVEFVGDEGNLLASGSSDRTIFLWKTLQGQRDYDSEEDGDEDDLVDEMLNQGRFKPVEPEGAFLAHNSRIWDLVSNKVGTRLASAAGDGTVRLWDVDSCLSACKRFQRARLHEPKKSQTTSSLYNSNQDMKFEELHTLHEGDVYSLSFDADQRLLLSSGYDRTARLLDLETNKLLKVFSGHNGAVTHAVFNTVGNLVITGSKDCSIRFWDILSGVCVKTFSQKIGEISSIDTSKSGQYILSNSKDSSIRLWDFRAGKSIRKYRGHQNTSRNFVRAIMGPMDSLVMGGSEDGRVYIWDTESGELLDRLRGHKGTVFQTKWNESTSLLASCSDDGSMKTWHYR
mmetsp:Transcript_6953/g.9033  ORF Transcript_6953/g.9033 Transcript_6953/m.9033 type:complete len:1004 (+) Transcript_6953:244-3255(+)